MSGMGVTTPLFDRLAATLADDGEVVFGYLFGSQATGLARASSDVDVAVFLQPGADGFESKLRILGRLQAAAGSDLVDLVVLNTAPVSLAGRVLASRRVLVDRDPPARHRYESLTAREFRDFRIREHRLLDAMLTHGRP